MPAGGPEVRIVPARTPEDVRTAAGLIAAYAAGLGLDLSYQDFERELAGLPGAYAPPRGALLLARDAAGTGLGCVALRPLGETGAAEVKRLHVVPAARGGGLGRALMQALIAEARRLGYRELRLDTLPDMAAAMALYRAAGFRETPPYYDTPVAGTRFFALVLG